MSGPVLPTQDRVEGYFREFHNWGRWGHDDQLGTLNLITPEKQARARDLIQTGQTVSLARDVIPRPVYMYHATFPSKRERVDVVLDRFDMVYHGFWITHVDALCHVALDGELYNGRSFIEHVSVQGATWCPIDPTFTKGITTRGVFLDVASARKEGFVTIGHPVTPQELNDAERRSGVKVEPGDVVVVRSGDADFRQAHPDWIAGQSLHPGLNISCIEWFREKDIAAIAWDMMDEKPSGYEGFGMSAHMAIPLLGLTLIDNLDPERLAIACAEQGRNEFYFTATPLRLVGATGAPAHPLAIF